MEGGLKAPKPLSVRIVCVGLINCGRIPTDNNNSVNKLWAEQSLIGDSNHLLFLIIMQAKN